MPPETEQLDAETLALIEAVSVPVDDLDLTAMDDEEPDPWP